MSMQPAREAIRQRLAHLRVQITNNIFVDNTYPYKERTELTVELQKEYQDLLIDFLDLNGKIQAVPVYHNDCTANAVRIQTGKIGQLFRFVRRYDEDNIPRFLADEPRHENGSVHMDCPVVKARDGCTRKLSKLSGSGNEPREDKDVRKWLFADLREDETMDTLIREKARWGWCGKFGLSRYFLIRQEEQPVDASVPTSMLLQ